MKLSVIIPTYKFSKYIRQCIESVLSQKTDFNFEILVRDDFSNDGSDKIIENIISENKNTKATIKNFQSTENWGGFRNIKFLLDNCKGEYIAYLDGDDYFTDDFKLQKQVDFLDNNIDYTLTSTGSFLVDENCNDLIGDWRFLVPKKSEVTLQDILENNIISFGRVFRNVGNILDDEFSDIPFVDWIINYKLLLKGKAKCEDWCGGAYRNHGKGEITKLTEEESDILNLKVKSRIKSNYINSRSIVIIDCFVSNKKIESYLNDQIERIKKVNLDILLISNTKIPNYILEKVDYFIYDSRNQLFEKKYTNIIDVTFLDSIFEGDKYKFTTYVITPRLQKNGLSVLVNLFNSVNLTKSLGYQNFWRVEVDDLFGEKSLDFLKQSPRILEESNKKALLYYNPDNISFHFMFWNIDYFLEKIPQIRNEEDYRSLIIKNFGSLDFVIAEEFIWKFLKINGDSEVLIGDGQNMSSDFPDTTWNTNMSLSNLSPKYEMCPTSIFRMNGRSGLFLFTKNHSNLEKSRKIIIHYQDRQEVINHNLSGFNTWCWNIIEENPYKYEVYEGERLLFVEDCKEIKNYVEFP